MAYLGAHTNKLINVIKYLNHVLKINRNDYGKRKEDRKGLKKDGQEKVDEELARYVNYMHKNHNETSI